MKKILIGIFTFLTIGAIPTFAACTITATPTAITSNVQNVVHVHINSTVPYSTVCAGVNGWSGIPHNGSPDGCWNNLGEVTSGTYDYYMDPALTPTEQFWAGGNAGLVCDYTTITFTEYVAPAAAKYTPNASATSAVTGLLTSMVATVFTVIPVAIGLVGALVVTLFGIRWLVAFARSHMHG
jgi:hypothetical protein